MKKSYSVFYPQLVGVILLLVFTLVVVACANMSSATPIPTATMAAQPNIAATSADIEETPEAGAVTVHVTLKEYSITSSITTFRTGVPYYFIVNNRGGDYHEFLIIPGKVDSKKIPTLDQLNHDFVEIDPVGPQTTIRVNYTFPSSAVGLAGMACLMRGHYMAGMHLSLEVKR